MKKSIHTNRSIVLVQFRTDESFIHERMCFYTKLLHKDGLKLTIINAFDTDVDWENPEKFLCHHDGVILGGSSEFHFPGKKNKVERSLHRKMLKHMKPFVAYLLKNDYPTLGICFGHQLIGHLLGVKIVRSSHQGKTGSFVVRLNKMGIKDPLYTGFTSSFKAQYAHKDILQKLPDDCILLGTGSRCHIASYRYKENIYCVQFHPELAFDDIMFRMRLAQEYLKGDIEQTKKLFQSTIISERILSNFIVHIASPT